MCITCLGFFENEPVESALTFSSDASLSINVPIRASLYASLRAFGKTPGLPNTAPCPVSFSFSDGDLFPADFFKRLFLLVLNRWRQPLRDADQRRPATRTEADSFSFTE